jgi:FkbH-like protein
VAETITLVNEVLTQLFRGQPMQAVDRLQKEAGSGCSPQLLSLLRLAAQRPCQPFLYYLKLHNLWTRLGTPALKPNASARPVLLLTDFTADGLKPLITLFAGTLGVSTSIEIPPFDSVEQLVLNAATPLPITGKHIVILGFSEHWLKRYLGSAPLIEAPAVERVKEVYQSVLSGLRALEPAHILLMNFPARSYALPGGNVALGEARGWNRVVAHLNDRLGTLAAGDTHVVDIADAVFAAGGRAALGRLSYLRSKMVFEAPGTIAVARELAFGIAHVCGKTHRALVTDWDNTLWGGEVAELGSHGVVCGHDSPDALGFLMVQEYIRGLKSFGVLLAAASKNDPRVQKIFGENPELPLKLDDFASLQVSWDPKSRSLERIAAELGFGTEYMVFVDDSLFELAEVVAAHPHVDVLPAGPDAETTLRTLSESRFFNVISLSAEDAQRSAAAQALKQQRELQAKFTNVEDFLRSIRIRLEVSRVNDQNRARVLQMFQKSNQFNLTTRRHGDRELRQFEDSGAMVGVFSYEDAFGPQGIIAVVNLLSEPAALRIESWVMSCRVLNRTVEQAVFAWILEQAAGRPIVGEYIPTEKNGLVRDLYARLGFMRSTSDTAGTDVWCFEGAAAPKHFAEIKQAA